MFVYIYMYVCVCLYVYICWERLKAKGEEGGSLKWLGSITDSMDMNLSKLLQIAKYRKPGMLHSMGHKDSDMT